MIKVILKIKGTGEIITKEFKFSITELEKLSRENIDLTKLKEENVKSIMELNNISTFELFLKLVKNTEISKIVINSLEEAKNFKMIYNNIQKIFNISFESLLNDENMYIIKPNSPKITEFFKIYKLNETMNKFLINKKNTEYFDKFLKKRSINAKIIDKKFFNELKEKFNLSEENGMLNLPTIDGSVKQLKIGDYLISSYNEEKQRIEISTLSENYLKKNFTKELIFEKYLSEERTSPPDMEDMDNRKKTTSNSSFEKLTPIPKSSKLSASITITDVNNKEFFLYINKKNPKKIYIAEKIYDNNLLNSKSFTQKAAIKFVNNSKNIEDTDKPKFIDAINKCFDDGSGEKFEKNISEFKGIYL